jgi:hypothetical protein
MLNVHKEYLAELQPIDVLNKWDTSMHNILLWHLIIHSKELLTDIFMFIPVAYIVMNNLYVGLCQASSSLNE